MDIFQNRATLSYNGNTISSNVTTGRLVLVPAAEKTSANESYTPGEAVTYVISLINPRNVALENLTITDNLGQYVFDDMELVPLTYLEDSVLLFINGVLQEAPDVESGPPLVISGIDIPANGSAIIIYQAEANEFAPPALGGTITNEAVINGFGSDDVPCANVTVTETVPVEESANLSISKVLYPETICENSTLTYTFIIHNTGNVPIVATDDVIITDTFDPILTDIVVTFNGEEWAEPENYTYDESTGDFSTAAGQIVVPAATFTRDEESGEWITTPGVSILTISGTV